MVINSSVFSSHLFLRPSYGHYYYGDYYGTNYAGAGYSPWFSYNSSRLGYDPFYAQQRWNNRLNSGWDQTIQTNYRTYQTNANTRPPRTWSDYQARIASSTPATRQNLLIAQPFSEYSRGKESAFKYQAFDKTERQQFTQRELAYRQLRDQRQKLESQAADIPDPTKSTVPREVKGTRVKLPSSPIRYAPADQIDKAYVPPKGYDYPQADPKIAPTARRPRLNPGSPPMSRPVDPQPNPNVRMKPVIDPKPNPGVGPKPDVGPKPTVAPKPDVGPKPNPSVGPKAGPGPKPKPEK